MATKNNLTTLGPISAVLVAALSLSACINETAKWSGSEPEKRNKVEMVRLIHDVHFSEADTTLSAEAQSNLDGFLNEVNLGYGDHLVVDNSDNKDHGNAVISYLKSRGQNVMPAAVPLGLGTDAAAVRIAVERYVVTLPACPDWRQASWPNYDNAPTSNFGCATASALGMMVANPRDLIEGQEFAGPDATRATTAVERYQADKVKWPSKSGSASTTGKGGNGSDSSTK